MKSIDNVDMSSVKVENEVPESLESAEQVPIKLLSSKENPCTSHSHWAFEEAQRLAKIGSYEIDIKTRASNWSKQAAINFGFLETFQMEFVKWSEVIHPDDLTQVLSYWQDCLENKKDFDLEYRIQKLDGETAVIHGLGTIAIDEHGDLKMIGTLQDVTEIRIKETLLREQEGRLVHTSRLSELGEVVGGVAHEINNPLAIIMGKANYMERNLLRSPLTEALSEKLRQECSLIQQMGGRIDHIIRGMQAFASDDTEAVFAPQKLEEVIENAAMFWKQKCINSQINLKLEINPKDQLIDCRGIDLSRALSNLLSNSYDAVKSSQAKWIKVMTLIQDDRLKIEISDSGAGVDQAIQDKIMLPFFTTKEMGAGTGLGLSIASGIAKAHHGSLTYDGSGEFPKFVFNIPIQQPPKKS